MQKIVSLLTFIKNCYTMKKKWILILSIFLGVSLFSQTNKDLLFLEKELENHNYLFHTLNKNNFKKIIQKEQTKTDSLTRWKIDELLANFKEFNLKTISNKEEEIIFKIKSINNKLYITNISKEYSFLLEEEIIKLNKISINALKKRIKQKFYLSNTIIVETFLEQNLGRFSFLNYLGYIKNNSIDIVTKNFKGKITVSSSNLEEIKIEKPLFKNRRNDLWFWSYGINFGQQVYLKFNHILSDSHLKKIKDSLKWSNYKYAKTYHIPIQSTYNAPKFINLINKLHVKFGNKRYKKLIIDFRDTRFGTTYNLDFFISHLKKIKKLHKKKSIYVLFNKHTNGTSLKYIKSLQENFKPVLVGESAYGTYSDSNEVNIIELPISKIKIQIPIKHQQEIEIKPNIKVIQTLQQTKKGIDAGLNKCLE